MIGNTTTKISNKNPGETIKYGKPWSSKLRYCSFTEFNGVPISVSFRFGMHHIN